MIHNTGDNASYYNRQPSNKSQQIFNVVKDYSDINKVFDVGCNNGDMSYRLQKELGMDVYGVDISKELKTPPDYKFDIVDITDSNSIYYNDLTLFLSLYHHLLGAHGLQQADDIFFKLLLRSDYLIFDTGNVSETSRSAHSWHIEQRKHFKNELELLKHFNLEYKTLGSWNVAKGKRSLVMFSKESFDNNVKVLGTYKRYAGRANQKKGLVNVKDCKPPKKIGRGYVDENNVYHGALFFKLQIGNKTFFAKKHTTVEKYEEQELKNISLVYNTIPKEKLITYYGISKRYGLIYEWLNKFEYVGKTDLVMGNKKLHDVDVIKIKGQTKYIDFVS